MDVAFGATDVPLPSKILGQRGFFVLAVVWALSLGIPRPARAITESQPIHFSGDKKVWDRKANLVELFGHAAVNQPGETLTADYIKLDLNSRVLDATGNCVYIASESVLWGEEMHFNLNTRTGSIIAGRVSNDRFTLRGERIEKVGPGHFKTRWGDYTTCRDCAASWSFLAEDVDMEMEGYGYFSNVTTRIKGSPAFWFPYLIVPVKTQRQTGFLFPPTTFGGANGATFLIPFFWATSRSTDMTLGAGYFSRRGPRLTWEGRYSLTPRSSGQANFYYVNDKTFSGFVQNRWGLNITQTQELPYGIVEKLRFAETSDNNYPFLFPTDLPSGNSEAFLPSTLSLTRNSADVSAYLAFQRYRNLLNSTPNDLYAQQVKFDERTVQAFPQVFLTTNDRPLFNTPFVGGISTGFSNFTRAAGGFDYDSQSVPFGTPVPANPPAFIPGQDPIRKALRFSVTPTLYTTLRLFDTISIIPTAQYRAYFYNFGDMAPPLSRGYLHLQTDLTTQLEKIYEYPGDKEIPRVKHLIRPLLNYSIIPTIQQDPSHAFVRQINNALQRPVPVPGYYFDDYDIIPYSYSQTGAGYFIPQGHSLSYGLTMQWIRRRGPVTSTSPSYQTIVELTSGQSVNFLEITQPIDPHNPHPLTRFFSTLNFNFDNFTWASTYYYYPEIEASTPRHTISTSASFIWERSVHQNVLNFDRSFTLGYSYSHVNARVSNLTGNVTFSLNDYLLPNLGISYDFETMKLFSTNLGIRVQNPSRCWRFSLSFAYRIETGEPAIGFDWELNLSGSGFGAVTDFATQVVQRNSL